MQSYVFGFFTAFFQKKALNILQLLFYNAFHDKAA